MLNLKNINTMSNFSHKRTALTYKQICSKEVYSESTIFPSLKCHSAFADSTRNGLARLRRSASPAFSPRMRRISMSRAARSLPSDSSGLSVSIFPICASVRFKLISRKYTLGMNKRTRRFSISRIESVCESRFYAGSRM